MKKIIKQKWFPLVVALVLELVLIGFLYYKGFRITYAPGLENSWDAISACAAWAGVGASFVAIWFAIRVPQKIAEQQDNIALFEKRYDCYTVIQNLLVCAEQMEDAQTNKGVQTAFRIYLGQPEKICDNESSTVFAVQLKQKQAIIVSGAFLFSHYDVELLQKIIDVGIDLILKTAVSDLNQALEPLSTQAARIKQEYCKLCRQYANTYIDLMEKELKLKTDK